MYDLVVSLLSGALLTAAIFFGARYAAVIARAPDTEDSFSFSAGFAIAVGLLAVLQDWV